MPTITPSGTSVPSAAVEPALRHRPIVSVSTRNDIPSKPRADSQGNPVKTEPVSGQPTISEETAPRAVTLSPQLTALARKQQKLEQEKAAFEATKGNFVPKDAILAAIKGNKPSEALKQLGIDYNELSAAMVAELNGQDPVKALEAKVDQLQKSQEENVNKQFEATLKQYRAEADALITADPKAYHFITKGKLQDAVVQHIVETWEENPDSVLTVAQAAKEVEEVLREDAKAAAAALREIEPPTEEVTPPAPQTRQLPPPQRQAPRTLTHQVDAPPAPRVPNQMQHLSMKERLAEAIRRAQRTG